MIVHLGGSVRGTGADLPYMRRITQTINEFGGEIALNWIENSRHKADAQGRSNFEVDWSKIVRGNDEALQRADVFIAEVTSYRLYHGYEIANALAMHKPVLLLSRSPFHEVAISGVNSPLLSMHKYEDEHQLDQIVKSFLHENSVPEELRMVEVPISPVSYKRLGHFSKEAGQSIEEASRELIANEANMRLSKKGV